MLVHLSVSNFAIIEQSEMPFETGFTAITGETGAGKSILVGALNLILGQRANLDSVLDSSKKALVEASFAIDDTYQDFFTQHDLDFEPITLVRRELLPNNKSRAFINDTPVTLEILKEFSNQVVDLHQQHESLSLVSLDFQRMVIDVFADTQSVVKSYQAEYKQWTNINTTLQQLKQQEAEAKSQRDFIEYQVNELEKAQIQHNEFSQIEQKLKQANNQEFIYSSISQLNELLDGDESSVLQLSKQARSILQNLEKKFPESNTLYHRIDSLVVELEDIVSELNDLNSLEIDPLEIQELEKRSDTLNHLLNKHQVSTSEELLQKQAEFIAELEDIDSKSDQINSLEKQASQIEESLTKQAQQLSKKRREAVPHFEQKMNRLLQDVGLEKAKIQVQLTTSEELTSTGLDQIQLLFSANEGHEPKPLKNIASGGELSRLMLALKSIIAEKTTLPTMIFDEIDTGISGEVAKKVAKQFQKLAQNHQIIAITHLPQIAAKANHHLKVEKQSIDGFTRSSVRVLDQEAKVLEIAEMLSGQNPSDTTINAAIELITS